MNEGKQLTVRFSRTVRPGDYQSMTADVAVSDTVGEEVDVEAALKDLLLTVRAVVYQQLGIDFQIDAAGVAQEATVIPAQAVANVQAAFPAAQVVPTVQAPRPVAAPVAPAPAPMPVPPTPGMAPTCTKCGGQMYDNRADNDRRRNIVWSDGVRGAKLRPDFKCKNCGDVIWPPDFANYRNARDERTAG